MFKLFVLFAILAAACAEDASNEEAAMDSPDVQNRRSFMYQQPGVNPYQSYPRYQQRYPQQYQQQAMRYPSYQGYPQYPQYQMGAGLGQQYMQGLPQQMMQQMQPQMRMPQMQQPQYLQNY